MNLAGMMKEVGIGCGENCRCAKMFVDTLDDSQQAIFAHMIEAGAKKRLKKIKKAGKRDKSDQRPQSSQRPSLGGFFEQMFEDAFGPDREKGLSPFATMMRAMAREQQIEPYAGDLSEGQIATLAETNEDIRTRVEEALRKLIASRANNDPSRIKTTVTKDGADVEFEVLAAAGDEGTEPGDFMTMLRRVLQGRQTRMSVEPYAGDLTADQLEILAAVDEPLRDQAEAELRQVIAADGDGDPRRVQAKSSKRGNGTIISVLILPPIDEAADGESTKTKDKAA